MARSFLQIAFVDILFVDILERCVLLAERERKRMVRLSEMCVHLRRSSESAGSKCRPSAVWPLDADLTASDDQM